MFVVALYIGESNGVGDGRSGIAGGETLTAGDDRWRELL